MNTPPRETKQSANPLFPALQSGHQRDLPRHLYAAPGKKLHGGEDPGSLINDQRGRGRDPEEALKQGAKSRRGRCYPGIAPGILRCGSRNSLILQDLRRLRKSPCAAFRHEPAPAQWRNLPYHSVLRRLTWREGCRPAGRGRSPCWIDLPPHPPAISRSRLSRITRRFLIE